MKYELINTDTIKIRNRTLYRIRALKDFGDVKRGDLGGYIESEANLSHDGNCWVYNCLESEDGEVWEVVGAYVYGDARIFDDAEISGMAQVYGDAEICGTTEVYGKAKLGGKFYAESGTWT